MNDEIKNIDIIEYIISEESKGLRADQGIALENPQYSRSLIQKWIKKGSVLVNNKTIRTKEILLEGDKISITPEENISTDDIRPENIKIEIAYEDEDLIVINKHSNIIAHPAAGHHSGTLANGLVYMYPELSNLPRSGLIHRLDKDTTGLLIVARNIKSYTVLARNMQDRVINRYYTAYTHGLLMQNGEINKPIARHKVDRKKMAVRVNGKEAITNYEVVKSYKNFSKLKLKLHTGRTHQIRVHMQSVKYPIIGDQSYGIKSRGNKEIDDYINKFPRQALHAEALEFTHPNTRDMLKIKANLPEDLLELEKMLDEQK